MYRGQSAQQPSSARSSSGGSGCCRRSRGRSDCSSAYHGTHHTSGRPAHMASLPPESRKYDMNHDSCLGGGGGGGWLASTIQIIDCAGICAIG